ncbi:MAG: ATP-dependent acyl-CoA ligase [Rhodoferax sp.]|nr:ATP-dependent acyl-CoA ligase [Rhodoferax sp.]
MSPHAATLPEHGHRCALLADLPASLGEALRAAAAEAPGRPFIRMATGEWTYGWIDDESDRVAAGLHALGVRPGDNVSLLLPNRIEFAVLWFALAKLGAVTAPVNTAFRGAALRDAIDLVQSRLVITDTSLQAALAEVLPGLPRITQQVLIGGGAPDPGQALGAPAPQATCLPYASLHRIAPDARTLPRPAVGFADLCLLLYTSGTTGRSKAAMIPHRFVLGHARLTIEGLGLRPDDVLYCPYPMYHLDAAVMTLAPALLLRGVAAIGERFSVSRYWDEMRAFQATVFDFMGATLTMLWKQPASPRDRKHRARLGWGVPLPAWAPEFEARFGCRLVELYGSTEAGVMIFTPQDAPRRVGSCGRPIGPFEVALQDEDGFVLQPGHTGELVIRALEPGLLMSGYYGMPDASLQAFRNLWFHTGDLLRQDEDGYLYFVGRRKDMVRRRGENISAAEVEQVIESHPGVLACAVYGVPSEMTEEEVMACVVPRPGAALDAPALAAWCATRMARFMVPRYLRFADSLPKTPTDKVEKFRLQQQGITPDTWDREPPTRTP